MPIVMKCRARKFMRYAGDEIAAGDTFSCPEQQARSFEDRAMAEILGPDEGQQYIRDTSGELMPGRSIKGLPGNQIIRPGRDE